MLFFQWCRDRLGSGRARLCLLVLLVYPFSFYLMGAVYADGLFLLANLGAFLALEADRPVLPYLNGQHAHLLGNAIATVVVVAFIPIVFGRFGAGYGVYALAVVAGAAISTKDFVGMGRYCLAAFPCFAAAGDVLFGRRRAAVAAVAGCAVMLVVLAEFHARGTLVS